MSRTDPQRELERWKDKYFDLNDEVERERKEVSAYTGLLQRFLVRISLAAEHVSDELDRELNSLRVAVREATPAKNDLDRRLKRIDAILLSTDEQKNLNAEKAIAAFNDLINHLLQTDIPRRTKRSLNKLAKSLAERGAQFQEYPSLISEYAALQAEALKVLVKEEEGTGFFSKLFGGKTASAAPVDGTQPEQEQTTSAELDQDLDLEDSRANINDFRAVPGYAAIARHIQGTLERLLEQLIFPVNVQGEVAELKQRIANDLNWYELGPTLSDLANLVISAVGKGQRDFERFLLVLNERLSRVQSSLIETETLDQTWRKQNNELDRVMREHVSEMSREVSMASDIEGLKHSITSRLDEIASVMDGFSSSNQQRESDKDQQLKALRERLQNMEKEASDIRRKLKEEREHALTDILTGLPNREAWDERFELEHERWKRYRKPVVLVVADVDLFKRINDTYGHLAGDKVLQILAKEMRNRIRKTDFIARLGGEEFVILLPETEMDVAVEVIEKTREMVSRLPFHFKDERVTVSLSFGVVPFVENMERDALFALADEAMYRAKQAGRNRVERAQVPVTSGEKK
jgi:diguanylate cyclase